MGDWTRVRLGDVIDVKHGYAFKGEFFHDEPPGDFLLTPGNFAIGGGFQWGKRKFYRDGPIPADYVLEPGDILITMTDLSKIADTLGYSAVVPESDVRLLHNQRLGKVILKSTAVDKSYIHWLLRTPDYRNEILASYTGSTVKHTSPKKILTYTFYLPSLPEQGQIVAVLDALDDKIELNRRMNETLEAMARAIFKDWFVDFGPTRAKMEGRAPYLAPEIWDLFPDALDDEDKPVGWKFGTIGTLAEIKAGKRPSSKFSEPDGAHRVPVYGGNGISWYTNEPLYNPPFLITGRVGTLGTVFRVYENVWVSDNALCCFPIESKSFELLYFCLKSLDYDSLSAGSTQPLLTQTVLKTQEVMIGGQRVRDAFSDYIRPLFSRAVHGARESHTLGVFRDFLLPKLMSGEVRLRGAEKAAEAVA